MIFIQLQVFFHSLLFLILFNLIESNQNDFSSTSEENLQEYKDSSNIDSFLNNLKNNIKTETKNDLSSYFDSSIFYNLNWKEKIDGFYPDKNNDSIVTVFTKDQDAFHCVIPEIKIIEENEKRDDKIDPYSKIEIYFEQNYCSYKIDSYWTYEFCFKQHLRQFNGDIIGNKPSQNYMLGYFDNEDFLKSRKDYNEKIEELKKQGKDIPKIDFDGKKEPYIYFTMIKGTTCDITNEMRSTKVNLICGEYIKPQLESIEEIKSCEYEAIVSTKLLCDHPDFKEKKKNELNIDCYPNKDQQLVKPKGVEQYEVKESQNKDSMKGIAISTNSFLKMEIEPYNIEKKKMPLEVGTGNDKLLDSFIKGIECLESDYKVYWKYKFCFNDEIIMYHEEFNVKTQTIILGKFDVKEHLKWIQSNPDKKKKNNELNFYYSSGMICHEIGRYRFVEVKIVCSNGLYKVDKMTMVLTEPKLCEYKLYIESSFFCPLFDLVDENGIIVNI